MVINNYTHRNVRNYLMDERYYTLYVYTHLFSISIHTYTRSKLWTSHDYTKTHHSPNGLQIREEVAMTHKLSDEAQWLLYRYTANEIDDVWIVAMANLLHGINLV